VYAEDGALVGRWTSLPDGVLPPIISAAVSVPTGRFRVRVAAVAQDGRVGVLDQDLDAILEGRGQWQVSSLMLGLSRGGRFVPTLQFADEPVAIGMVEVFGPTPAAGLVSFEIAQTLDGPALVTVPGTLTATSDPLRHVSTGALPIGGFGPGRWVVRAVVTPGGLSPLRVVRTLEKVAR
jgi:hypothetical protein